MDFKDFEIVTEQGQCITMYEEDGTEVLCQILFSLVSKKLNKTFVVFSKVDDIEKSLTLEDDEQVMVGAAKLISVVDGQGELGPIETDEEWAIVEEGLRVFDEEYEEECDCCHCHSDEDGNEVCECDEECEHEHHCCCHHEEE